MPVSAELQVHSDDRAGKPVAKRRRLRRGTSSCWECKRRKVRCDFVSDSKAVCISCERRGTKCVLQDVPEEEVSAGGDECYREVEKSIAHVEMMVNQLIQDPMMSSTSSRTSPDRHELATNGNVHSANPRQMIHGETPKRDSKAQRKTSRLKRLMPLARKASSEESLRGLLMHDVSNAYAWEQRLGPPSPFSLSSLVYSYLPPVHLADQIMRHGKFRSFAMQMLRKPLMSFLKQTSAEDHPHLRESLEPTAQPIVLARKLIQLAICLQQMDPVSDASQLRLDGSTQDVASRFFNAASSYVTSQDSLIISLDGLETLMLEGHFHLNSGNYKLSWLVFRRAMDIAHLLGLHANQAQEDSEKQGAVAETVCTDYLWFRLIYINRYLSMMLSLPTTNVDYRFSSGQQLTTEQGLEKLERIHASVMDRIVSRNERMRSGDERGGIVYDHYGDTQEIDHELKQAAKLMPARWWAVPVICDTDSEMQTKGDTARLVLQIHQHNLLATLHAPYVIPGVRSRAVITGGQTDYAYSRTAALSACRESLVRFPLLSKSKHIPFSSRGMNFKAFISATTLLCAHIAGHQLGRANVLEHQRPSDLSLVDDVVEKLGDNAGRRSDLVNQSCVRALRTLLDIEADAADGSLYYIWSEATAIGQVDCTTTRTEDETEVMVPTFGTIHIKRRIIEPEPKVAPSVPAIAPTAEEQQSISEASSSPVKALQFHTRGHDESDVDCSQNDSIRATNTDWSLDPLHSLGDLLNGPGTLQPDQLSSRLASNEAIRNGMYDESSILPAFSIEEIPDVDSSWP